MGSDDAPAVAGGEPPECCVCYGRTEQRTPCGHLLCGVCLLLLPKKLCPLCRRQLRGARRPGATPGSARALSARGTGPLAEWLRPEREDASALAASARAMGSRGRGRARMRPWTSPPSCSALGA